MGEEAQISVKQKRRSAPDDADRPGPSQPKRIRESTPNAPCAPCTHMFSKQGLSSLNSPNGFRHRTRTECMASGNEGCRICKFVYLAVCKEYDENWAGDDPLIFRNFRSAHSTSTVPNIRPLAGVYGLKGSLESEPDKCLITIYPFAEKSKILFSILSMR